MTSALIWLLQAIGCLWAVGGVFAIRMAWSESRIDAMIAELNRIAEDLGAPPTTEENDAGRAWWLTVGGGLTTLAGAGLILASWLVLPILGLLLIHQALYAIRQAARVRAATTEEEADDARLAPSTQRAALFSVAVTALAGALTYTGDLTRWGLLG